MPRPPGPTATPCWSTSRWTRGRRGRVSVRTKTPSVAELRAVAQPPEIFARNSGEHWAGRLYMRRLSPYVTRLVLRTPLTPNGVTWLMMVVGLAAAGVLTLPGLWAAAGALLLIQLQLLLDCVDGEMARWLDKRSPVGVYIDQLAHHITETALPIALGIRADGGWNSIDSTWTTIGLTVAVIQLLVKAETSLVHVARSQSKMAPVQDRRVVAEPQAGALRKLRGLAGRLPGGRRVRRGSGGGWPAGCRSPARRWQSSHRASHSRRPRWPRCSGTSTPLASCWARSSSRGSSPSSGTSPRSSARNGSGEQ